MARKETKDSGNKFHFSIDRGGTFTDIHCLLPNNTEIVRKLLSEDPDNYPDAPTEGIRRILSEHDTPLTSISYDRSIPVNTSRIGSIRMGTTVATNALLERKGERMGLVITKGFKDLLKIGNQSRSNIFDLACLAPGLLYGEVVEVDERIMLANFMEDEDAMEVDEKKEVEEPPSKKTKLSSEDASSSEPKLSSEDSSSSEPKAGIGPRHTGTTSETIISLRPPNLTTVREQLLTLKEKGIQSLAIVLLHSYVYPTHEEMIGQVAKDMGCFKEISMSSVVMPMVKVVPR
jgi:5-oxoprolinase (ATP-hydrolysing)